MCELGNFQTLIMLVREMQCLTAAFALRAASFFSAATNRAFAFTRFPFPLTFGSARGSEWFGVIIAIGRGDFFQEYEICFAFFMIDVADANAQRVTQTERISAAKTNKYMRALFQ